MLKCGQRVVVVDTKYMYEGCRKYIGTMGTVEVGGSVPWVTMDIDESRRVYREEELRVPKFSKGDKVTPIECSTLIPEQRLFLGQTLTVDGIGVADVTNIYYDIQGTHIRFAEDELVEAKGPEFSIGDKVIITDDSGMSCGYKVGDKGIITAYMLLGCYAITMYDGGSQFVCKEQIALDKLQTYLVYNASTNECLGTMAKDDAVTLALLYPEYDFRLYTLAYEVRSRGYEVVKVD